jgi:hypothetical protein
MNKINGFFLAGLAALLLANTAEAREAGKKRHSHQHRRVVAEQVEWLDTGEIAREIAARQAFGDTPQRLAAAGTPAERLQKNERGALNLCFSRCVDDPAQRPASGIDFDDSALAAQTRKMGMGLKWAALPNLGFSADYERAMAPIEGGRIAPEVVRARMQWRF